MLDRVIDDAARAAGGVGSDEAARRRAGIRASLACEGMILTEAEERLLARMDEEGLTVEERDRLALEHADAIHGRG